MSIHRHDARNDASDATHVLCVLLPLKIESEANGREHWRAKAARAKSHRAVAKAVMGKHAAPCPPMTITLTRIAPRKLDDDNLASGFKATRDGIADWLGIDDGDERLTWRYAQQKGPPKHYAASVIVESAIRAVKMLEKA